MISALSQIVSKPPKNPRVKARIKLLCATDLTARSDRAIERAVLLSKQTGAEILFLHVVDDNQSERVIQLKANRARVRLLLQAERVMKHAPESASVVVRFGKPLKVITGLAKEWDADLIVLAAPIRRAQDSLIGTTAERIVRGADRAVLFVRQDPEQDYRTVAIATDLSAASSKIARAAHVMGVLNGADTSVVHAFDPPYHGMISSHEAFAEQIHQYQREWHEHMTFQLRSDLAESGLDLSRVQISAEPARPFDAIERMLERVQPELLVIGTSRWFMLKRMLLGSVAAKVLSTVECDVLAISPAAYRRPLFSSDIPDADGLRVVGNESTRQYEAPPTVLM